MTVQVPVVAVVNYPTPTALAVNLAETVVEPCSPRVRWGEEVQAKQGAGQASHPLEKVGPAFMANAEAPTAPSSG